MSRALGIIQRFPDFFQSGDPASVFYRFVRTFGQTLDRAELDLLDVMRAHWVGTANNEGSRGLGTAQKGDLDRIFSLYLEALGGTSRLAQSGRRSGPEGIEDDALYRERIRGLIQVLKEGASTREGLVTIAAANLGIVGNDPAAVAAREQIRIVEFLPEPRPVDFDGVVLFEAIQVENLNIVPTVPEIRLAVRPELPFTLHAPRVVHRDSGAAVGFAGSIGAGDVLSFFANGTAFLNGVVVPMQGSVPALLPGKNRLRIEAATGVGGGAFDASVFDAALFDAAQIQPLGVFDDPSGKWDEARFQITEPACDLRLTFIKLTPGSFMIRIPWDIPGFTDHFDELRDHPRNQIKYIFDRVKAAGVFSVIAYEKRFTETHASADTLIVQRAFPEPHLIEEGHFSLGSVQMPYPGGLQHELSDALLTSGVFDYSSFDSLNGFAS
jgi:hypothetical protein